MTTYHFEKIRMRESAFYPIREEGERGFRSAVATWMKGRRGKGQFVVMRCEKVVERLVTGENIFLGMRVTKEE